MATVRTKDDWVEVVMEKGHLGPSRWLSLLAASKFGHHLRVKARFPELHYETTGHRRVDTGAACPSVRKEENRSDH